MTHLSAALVLGLSFGAVYALLAAGVTVVYQVSRIPAVCVVAIGTVAAVLHGDLMTGGRLSAALGIGPMGWWPALGVAAVVAVGLGLASHLVTRSVRERVVAALVVCCGWTAVLIAAVDGVWGGHPKLLPSPWSGSMGLGDVVVPRGEVATILVAGAAAAAVALGWRGSRLGLAHRAAAADPDGLRLVGIDPARLTARAWVLASLLAALAMTLAVHPVLTTTSETTVYVAFAFGGALLGGFRRLDRAVAGGLALGVIPALASPAGHSGVGDLVALVLVAVLLVRRPGALGRPVLDEAWHSVTAASAAAAPAAPPRPLPAWARRGALGAGVGALAVAVPLLSADAALVAWTRGVTVFLVCAGIVIAVGWCGEVALGQVAFAGVGAYMVGNLATRAGMPHVLAVPSAALAATAPAVLLGVPAFRSRGRLAFAVVSLTGAVVAAALLWGPEARWFTGAGAVTRPSWMDALGGRPAASFYLVTLALAAAVVWFAANLRRSRLGRAFAAVADSEVGARSLGLDPTRYRLIAIAFSAFVAGLGGALSAYLPGGVDPTRFAVFVSVQYLLYVVVGGAASLAGVGVVVFAFEVAPHLLTGATAAPNGPLALATLGALAMASVRVPGAGAGLAVEAGGLAGAARLARSRLRSGRRAVRSVPGEEDLSRLFSPEAFEGGSFAPGRPTDPGDSRA